MGKVIACAFITLDGVVEDPDGSRGTPFGGWAWRYGPEPVDGDKFAMGPILDTGVMLLGRTTWELLGGIFPGRTDWFARKLNAIPKVVASHTATDVTRWANSTPLTSDLVTDVKNLREAQDVYIAGSLSVVEELQAHDLVDQYRLVLFPLSTGQGRRLVPTGDLELTNCERVGPAVRLTYDRVAA
ncbi:dihydrofolate reductase family protein [Kibdelosporangium lantanae]